MALEKYGSEPEKYAPTLRLPHAHGACMFQWP